MKKKNDLKKYLIGRFLLTLLCVGIFQVVINIAMRFWLLPIAENIVGIEGLLSGQGITEAIRTFMTCFFILLLRVVFGSSLFQSLLDSSFMAALLGDGWTNLAHTIDISLDDTQLAFYSVKVLLLFIILIMIWLFPYVLGAISYAKHVARKVNEIESERIQREKEYERQRNLLLSDITHDIKTPITTIAGFSKALSDGAVPEEQRKAYLDSIYNKSMTVSDLVSLLFEYIKLDSKGYSLNKERIDFAELIRECVAGVYTEFEEKGMTPELMIPDGVVHIFADKMQLSRAVNNLLTNEIRHNDANTTVEISLAIEGGEAVFGISDRGARIDREDAKHLFEPFVRGDKSRKSGKGNGLGLSIAKRIVELHGGKIMLIQYNDVEKHGKTKTFAIRIPVLF